MLANIGEDIVTAVLQGAPPGTVYALVALGFVLAYKTSGVFNLAFGAQAYASAVLYFKAHAEWGWPVLPSLAVAVFVLAPLVGFLLESLIFRHLRTAPPVSSLVVAIGLTIAIPSVVDLALDFQPRNGQIPLGIVPDGNSVYYPVFGLYSFSRDELMAMGVATAAMLALAAMFRFTMVGLKMRAVVESPRLTELNGLAADRISISAWMLSSLFAGLAGVLIAPRFPTLAPGRFFDIVVVAIAAAAVGALVSLPRAFLGGLGLGVAIALFNTFIPRWANDHSWLRPMQNNITPALPFVVLFLVLVFMPGLRRARFAADPLAGVDPPPRSTVIPAPISAGEIVRRTLGTTLLVVTLIVLLTRGDSAFLYLAGQGAALAVVYLSITIITGLAGHISLCQGSFAAVGAFTTYQLAARYDTSVLVGAVAGALVAAAVGALLSVPLVRLSGVWIAIATLAFAFFFDAVMVKFSWTGAPTGVATGDLVVPRPVIGPWDMASDKSFLAFLLAVLAIATVAVMLLSRSTTGRMLRATRGSEIAAQSIGISPTRARVLAFSIAAGLAGLGGALLVIQQESVNYDTNFAPFAALFWLVLVVTFGARAPEGAIAGAATFTLFDKVVLQGTFIGWLLRSPDRVPSVLPVSPKWRLVLFGLGTIQYASHPEGVLEMARARRNRRRAESDGHDDDHVELALEARA